MPVISLLAFGVAQDKTVFPAVLDQPLLDQGVLLPLVQNLIGGVYNVQGQARLVLTVPGTATTVPAS